MVEDYGSYWIIKTKIQATDEYHVNKFSGERTLKELIKNRCKMWQ